MIIVVINNSTKVSSKQLDLMVRAVNYQVINHICPSWGKLPIPVVSGTEPLDSKAYRIYLEDTVDYSGVDAFHTEDQGIIYGKVFVSVVTEQGGKILKGRDSVSVALSHEICEIIMNPYTTTWIEGPKTKKGSSYALEPSDPVQRDYYNIKVGRNVVSVSNFVFPSWYDPSCKERVDYLGKCKGPFKLSPGGYLAVRKSSGDSEIQSRFKTHTRTKRKRK